MGQRDSESIYLSHFGLRRNPFALTPDPRFFLKSKTHLDALASLIYGIKERKGFILLTGEVGTGKTTVVRTLLESIDPTVVFSHIINTDVSFLQLLRMVCIDFGLPVGDRARVQLVDDLYDFLVETRLEGRTALLIVDEAQNLSQKVMESLRMLSNLETPREKLLQILLCGQPELRNKLKLGSMRQLAQRIAVNAELSPLLPREVERYIYHRLKICNCRGDALFPNPIAARIAVLSRGIPRLINILCDACLMLSYAEGKRVVSRDVLGIAAGQCMGIDSQPGAEGASPTPSWATEHEEMGENSGAKKGFFLRGIAGIFARVAAIFLIFLLIVVSGVLARPADSAAPSQLLEVMCNNDSASHSAPGMGVGVGCDGSQEATTTE